MGKASREKGARGEREVAEILRAHGIKAKRTPNSGAWLQWPSDIHNDAAFAVEVKFQERLNLPAALRQVQADAPAGSTPMVVHRSSRQDWIVSLGFEEFLELVR